MYWLYFIVSSPPSAVLLRLSTFAILIGKKTTITILISLTRMCTCCTAGIVTFSRLARYVLITSASRNFLLLIFDPQTLIHLLLQKIIIIISCWSLIPTQERCEPIGYVQMFDKRFQEDLKTEMRATQLSMTRSKRSQSFSTLRF